MSYESLVRGYSNPCCVEAPNCVHTSSGTFYPWAKSTMGQADRFRRPDLPSEPIVPAWPMPSGFEAPANNWNFMSNFPMFVPTTPTMPGSMTTPWPSACPFISAPVVGGPAMNPAVITARSDNVNRDVAIMKQLMHDLYAGWERNLTQGQMTDIPYRPVSALEHLSLTNPIRPMTSYFPTNATESHQLMLWLCLDMTGFRPEEIKVTFDRNGRSINVDATFDCKAKLGGAGEHQIRRSYSRKYILPEALKAVDASKVEMSSHMTPNGTLVIEAVLPPMSREDRQRFVDSAKRHEWGIGDYIAATSPIGSWPPNMTPIGVKVNA